MIAPGESFETGVAASGSAATGETPSITAYGAGDRPPREDGRWRLQSERRWAVEGTRADLEAIKAVLPSASCEWAGSVLVLNLVNSVGVLDLPGLGQIELYTGKLGEAAFEALLADLTRLATSLPFAAGDPGSSPYTSGPPPPDEVLYHAFVYLRHILLSERAESDERLIPALELIQRAPHRRWRTERREVRIDALTRVDSRTLLDLVTRTGAEIHAPTLSPAAAQLAERLGGRLPEEVSERRIRPTIDTPENRFVKGFIGQAQGVIGRVRSRVVDGRRAFERTLLADCDRMDARLMPVVRHSMWGEVGAMTAIPFSSTVLQRRRGYRHVLRHFAKIRLAPRIPLDGEQLRNLLELKDIAHLYELWTYYRLAELISGLIGPPAKRAATSPGDFGVALRWGQTFSWTGGVRLEYNPSFSRSRKPPRDSYSMPLRPDIALYVPTGPNAGLHLLDAKFTVRTLSDAGLDASDEGEADTKAGERKGDFQRGDLYKMHTYRDAIHDARSVWILYPGSEFRFFEAPQCSGGREGGGVSGSAAVAAGPRQLPDSIQGVGAIPFAPRVDDTSGADIHGAAAATVESLLGRPADTALRGFGAPEADSSATLA
ncbi:MAG: DUF2357 domain-containing protein [Gemmatimonadota bacterium]|uniref:DUF2357 domain-containing protein n=1 Tax=Candidatus Palauibacter scopulicola TaxID=3056741 RepID=UPI00238BD9F3|nr:DUF2357 domain-containing protein [Candidatus Palauibacter scopulicola]MDE2662054.1 DUF2357 domain-containing protein [Candidatus Palauibacter scopulicola]